MTGPNLLTRPPTIRVAGRQTTLSSQSLLEPTRYIPGIEEEAPPPPGGGTITPRAYSSGNMGGASGTTFTITLPTGSVSGDLLVMLTSHRSQVAYTASNGPTDMGWTEIDSGLESGGEYRVYQAFFENLTNVTSNQQTFTKAAADKISWVIGAFTGVDTTTQFEAEAGQVEAGAATVTHSSPTINPANESFVFAMGGDRLTNQTGIAWPSGWTERTESIDTGTNSTSASLATKDSNMSAAGAYQVDITADLASAQAWVWIGALKAAPAGGTPVGVSLQTIWNVEANVGKDLQQIWNVNALVTKDLQTIWNVLVPVNKDLQTIWNVNSTAGKNLQLIWDVRAAAGKNLQLIWDVRATSGKSLQLIWNTLDVILVGKTLDIPWNVRANVGKSLQTIWNVNAIVGKSLDIRWNALALVNKSLQFIWNVRAAVGKNLQTIWNTAAPVGKSLQTIWNVRTFVNKNLDLLWNVNTSAGKSVQFIWNVAAASATVNFKNSLADTANATSYVSTAYTPGMNELIVVVAYGGGVTDPTTMSCSASSNGITTFTRAQECLGDASGASLAIFVSDALTTGTASMTHTITCGASTGMKQVVYTVSGMAKFGATAIKQIAEQENAATGFTPAVTFGATTLSGNPTIGVVGNNSNPAGVTEPTGWTEAADTGHATPAQGIESVYRNNGFAGTTITWGSTSATRGASAAIELDASSGAPVGKSLQALWNIQAAVGKNLQVIWTVRTPVGKSVEFLWNVLFTFNWTDTIYGATGWTPASPAGSVWTDTIWDSDIWTQTNYPPTSWS